MVNILPIPKWQLFNPTDGSPLAGGKVKTFVPNTLLAKTTWTDRNQTAVNPPVIILDANGEASIWGTGNYRIQVLDSNNNLLYDQETSASVSDASISAVMLPVVGAATIQTAQNLLQIPQLISTSINNIALLAGATGATGPGQGPTGPQGVVGATGSSGIHGLQGGAGRDGVVGATGNIGLQGHPGDTGASGLQGASGDPGGATGASGLQGVQGNTGAQGIQGVAGNTGVKGATGTQGNTGVQGATGSGATGASGSNGTNGATGATGGGTIGATGSSGINGATGATGSGSVGATGASGSNGTNGATGATGSGTVGATGATGSGSVGATGASGSNGTNGATGATGGGTVGATGSSGVNGATGATGSGTVGATGASGAGGGGALGLAPQVGRYYIPYGNGNLVAGTLDNDKAYAKPIIIYGSGTVVNLSTYINSNPSPQGYACVGIYSDTAGLPDALLVSGVITLPTSGGGWHTVTISYALTAGIYWIAAFYDTNAVTGQYTSDQTANVAYNRNIFDFGTVSLNSSTLSPSVYPVGYYSSVVAATGSGIALPNPFGSATAVLGAPCPLITMGF